MASSKSRLYVKARHLGYKRAMRDQSPKTSIVQLENVSSSADAKWYLGKRVAYLYHGQKAKVKKNGKKSHVRVMWGHITRVHGNSGLVRAKFVKPLPPSSFGSSLRVMLYPSQI